MFTDILSTVIGGQEPNAEFNLIEKLIKAHPNSQYLTLTAGEDSFPLREFLKSENIPVDVDKTQERKRYHFTGNSEKPLSTITAANVSKFNYKSVAYIHLVFDGLDDEPGKELAKAVYRWKNFGAKEEIWVYENGHWSRSASLYESICSSDWDALVLKDNIREGLKKDVDTFFNNKSIYADSDKFHIPWKRGILLLGPPGNGKTETVKRLLNDFKHIDVLYVKSFESHNGPQYGIQQIFQHARLHSPCILVIEDLDSMVNTSRVRSFFLNEIDGLVHNEGILTIATTNHPELIEDAILHRPSRFDAKYNFTLPEHDMRTKFAAKWIANLQEQGEDTGIHFDDVDNTAKLVADKTKTWSYAFLKELFISFTLRIAHDKACENIRNATSETLLLEVVDKLAIQISEVKKMKDEAFNGPGPDGDVEGMYR